ncbi:hypothetical protein [Brevundimonas sp. NPDC046655]|uniref:hypothetical protein n=1 Tax=unclassified Brevundimonas TaxID=2622653 RepID=UPI003850584A
MKFASVLAAAAAATLALTATAASAGPEIHRGATTRSLIGNTPNLINQALGTAINYQGSTRDAGFLVGPVTAAVNSGANLHPGIALFTMDSNGFADNQGTANASSGATFSLTGSVTPDCAYYTGGTDTTVNFGQIGINAQDNNPDAAFEMVGGDRTLDINSNLAGCNTKNTVTFSKTDLSTNAAAGFDGAQFTATIPVELSAQFTAGAVGATNNASLQTVSLLQAGNQTVPNSYGAWKSSLNMQVKMKNPGKALLAGTYNGTVGVTIAVAQ